MNRIEYANQQRIDEHAAYAATHVVTRAGFTDAGLLNANDRELLILVLHELVEIRRKLEQS